jgi:putative oxidoreductase
VLVGTETFATVAFVLLVLRVWLGGMIIAHGVNHVIGGGKLEGTGRWFASIGMRPGHANAMLATATELTCGVLLVLGLVTPLAAAALIGLMTVAIVTVHWKNGFFVFRPGQGIEYCVTVAVAAMVVGALGPGRWSIDHALGWWHHSKLTGLVVAVGAGLGGAALQLLACWRPPREAPA